MVSQSSNQYTAADLKLLTTLSLQSSAAIESTILYEKNLKEARAKEKAIRVLHEITSRFVPNEFIDFLGYKEITQVALGDSVEKEVTVLFSDIRGYTTLAESMSPVETFNFVNSFNGRMGPIIKRNRGFINQYLGDGIMAIFPIGPSDALRAAVEMHQELQLYNEIRLIKKRTPIKIGIGLHTGPLIMGIIGDDQRLDAATISDTVNTASRIESLTKFYGVNILMSEHSLAKIQSDQSENGSDKFHLRYLGKVQVKGKQNAIMIHECYDGDLPNIIQSKNKTLSQFDAALQNYHNKEFSNASKSLKAILDYNPTDKVASLYVDKITQFISEGINEEWSGVELMNIK